MLILSNDIRDTVKHFINKYKTNDPFEIAEYLNIVVQKGELGNKSGCYMYLKKNRCIFLNKDLAYPMMKVVMAHELCHAIMDTKTNCYFINSKTLLLTTKVEKRANIFASELLISDNFLSENEGLTIDQLSLSTGYDKNLFRLKLESLNNYI